MEAAVPDLVLATAMATSGAAASANMGRSTIKILTFSLSLLNIRLGYWLPNPARLGEFARRFVRARPNIGPWFFATETTGRLDEKTLNVYLTDGGHIENLGIYELLQRRCKVILAVDAEADPRLSGTIHAFMPLSPWRHEREWHDAGEPLAWRPAQNQISTVVPRVFAVMMVGEALRLVVDASGLRG